MIYLNTEYANIWCMEHIDEQETKKKNKQSQQIVIFMFVSFSRKADEHTWGIIRFPCRWPKRIFTQQLFLFSSFFFAASELTMW